MEFLKLPQMYFNGKLLTLITGKLKKNVVLNQNLLLILKVLLCVKNLEAWILTKRSITILTHPVGILSFSFTFSCMFADVPSSLWLLFQLVELDP